MPTINFHHKKTKSQYLTLLLFLLPAFLAPQHVHAIPAEQPSDEPTWSLIWSDDFNGEGAVDASKWTYDLGTGYPGGPPNWGTGEIEVMTNSLDNVFQSGGNLNIRMLHSGEDPLAGWTSGRIETVRTDFQPPEGGGMAIEARVQLPDLTGEAAKGYWPAFWTMGAPFRNDYWSWPGVGEIDILENINGLNLWWGTFHCGISPGGPCNEPSGIGGNHAGFSPSLQSAFHTYRLEFDKSVSPQELRWYVDGVQRFSLLSNQVDATTWENATNHGFFVILDLAIGGGWPGNPTTSTTPGGTMLVDYVRVYAWPMQSTYLPITFRK
jgi:beta-glucanase (GH16 family)